MKPIWMDEADLRQNLSREYRPGREDISPNDTSGSMR
jgi:hypothetical protein